MFQVNDLVVFGNHGICKVKAIGSLEMSAADEDRLYYTLKPLYEEEQQSAVYTPVDNQKTPLRAASTKEEALRLIERIPEIETIWVADERQREGQYKEIILNNDCEGWLQMVKTLHLKRQKRISEGKKNTAKDDFYFKMAEELLCGELAAVLEWDKAMVKSVISKKVSEEKS